MSLPPLNDKQLRALRRFRVLTVNAIALDDALLNEVLAGLAPHEIEPISCMIRMNTLSPVDCAELEERILNIARADYQTEFEQASFPDTIPIDSNRRWQRVPFPGEDSAYHIMYSLLGGLPVDYELVACYSHMRRESFSFGGIEYFRRDRREGEFVSILAERVIDAYSWEIIGDQKIIEPDEVPHILELADVLRALPEPFQTQFWPVYALAPLPFVDSLGTVTHESPSNYVLFE